MERHFKRVGLHRHRAQCMGHPLGSPQHAGCPRCPSGAGVVRRPGIEPPLKTQTHHQSVGGLYSQCAQRPASSVPSHTGAAPSGILHRSRNFTQTPTGAAHTTSRSKSIRNAPTKKPKQGRGHIRPPISARCMLFY